MNTNDLALLMSGQVPIIVIETHDEQQALALIDKNKRPRYSTAWKWTITDGLEPLGFGLELKNPKDYAKPEAMLQYIKLQHGNQLYVLCDLHPFWTSRKSFVISKTWRCKLKKKATKSF